jgi:hypothetical protein
VDVLADGTGVRVLANAPVNANGYLWYRVSSSDSTGWVASQFLQLQNCGSTDEPVITVGATVRVVDGPLNAREDADLSADVLQVLATGSIGEITAVPSTPMAMSGGSSATLAL